MVMCFWCYLETSSMQSTLQTSNIYFNKCLRQKIKMTNYSFVVYLKKREACGGHLFLTPWRLLPVFEFPCIISLYYIKNQQDATLAVLFITNCKITLLLNRLWHSAVATDLGRPYWLYIILTHDMHQWLLLQFLVLLMMEAESVRNM